MSRVKNDIGLVATLWFELSWYKKLNKYSTAYRFTLYFIRSHENLTQTSWSFVEISWSFDCRSSCCICGFPDQEIFVEKVTQLYASFHIVSYDLFLVLRYPEYLVENVYTRIAYIETMRTERPSQYLLMALLRTFWETKVAHHWGYQIRYYTKGFSACSYVPGGFCCMTCFGTIRTRPLSLRKIWREFFSRVKVSSRGSAVGVESVGTARVVYGLSANWEQGKTREGYRWRMVLIGKWAPLVGRSTGRGYPVIKLNETGRWRRMRGEERGIRNSEEGREREVGLSHEQGCYGDLRAYTNISVSKDERSQLILLLSRIVETNRSTRVFIRELDWK